MDTQIFQENIQDNIQDNIQENIQDNNQDNIVSNTLEEPLMLQDIESYYVNENAAIINSVQNEECLICFEPIYTNQKLWTCPQCNKIFHLVCKKKWEEVLPSPYFTCPHCKYKEPTIVNESNIITNYINNNDTIISHSGIFYYLSECRECIGITMLVSCLFVLFIIVYFVYEEYMIVNSYYNYTYIDRN
jgi:hypothetical protein